MRAVVRCFMTDHFCVAQYIYSQMHKVRLAYMQACGCKPMPNRDLILSIIVKKYTHPGSDFHDNLLLPNSGAAIL